MTALVADRARRDDASSALAASRGPGSGSAGRIGEREYELRVTERKSPGTSTTPPVIREGQSE